MTSDACHANVWVVLGEDEECREESRDEEWTDRNEVRCHGAAGKRMHVVVCAVHVHLLGRQELPGRRRKGSHRHTWHGEGLCVHMREGRGECPAGCYCLVRDATLSLVSIRHALSVALNAHPLSDI